MLLLRVILHAWGFMHNIGTASKYVVFATLQVFTYIHTYIHAYIYNLSATRKKEGREMDWTGLDWIG